MEYKKPPLTFEQQAQQLLNRGLVAKMASLVSVLEAVSYYRLSAYLYPFRERASNQYKPGATLVQVLDIYGFDHELRLLALEAVHWIEVQLRTKITYHISHAYGPFGYVEKSCFPNLSNEEHQQLLSFIEEETKRSRELFVKHFFKKYGDYHRYLPLWMATEVITFGTITTFFRGMEIKLKQKIAAEFGTYDTVLTSWILSINGLRNIAAHHGRLWNRVLGLNPKIPIKNMDFHQPVEVTNNKIFGIFTVMKYLLNYIRVDNSSGLWMKKLLKVLDDHSNIPVAEIGFPENWEECPIWIRNCK